LPIIPLVPVHYPKRKEVLNVYTYRPIVIQLIEMLLQRSDLKEALEISLIQSNQTGISSLPDFYRFVHELDTVIPTDRNYYTQLIQFLYLFDHSPHDLLYHDVQFQQWVQRFLQEWGNYLATPESGKGSKRFLSIPNFSLDDYVVEEGGWASFNDFFARQLKPGKRPIFGYGNDQIIVSAADSQCNGFWTIEEDSEVTVKSLTWTIPQLLDGSPFTNRFMGGIYMHSFLETADYHRFHSPVGGTVVEARNTHGLKMIDIYAKQNGSLAVSPGSRHQITQNRGLVVIETPAGLVAVISIGMAHLSSVQLSVIVDTAIMKGDELGYFLFGGSDIIVLFESQDVQLTVKPGMYTNQGVKTGYFTSLE
jgi:phosphatidylserine decarboxylase precursor